MVHKLVLDKKNTNSYQKIVFFITKITHIKFLVIITSTVLVSNVAYDGTASTLLKCPWHIDIPTRKITLIYFHNFRVSVSLTPMYANVSWSQKEDRLTFVQTIYKTRIDKDNLVWALFIAPRVLAYWALQEGIIRTSLVQCCDYTFLLRAL